LGPETGATIEYYWPVYWHFSGFLPVLAVLSLMLLPSNRQRCAWLIFIPALTVGGVFAGLGLLLAYLQISFAATSWVLGLAALWLIGDSLGRIAGYRAFVGAVTVLMVFSIGGGLLNGAPMSAILWMMPFSLTPVLALWLAAVWSRKRYSLGRYVGMLACSSLLVALVGVLLVMIPAAIIMMPRGLMMLIPILVGVPALALILGVLQFVALLAFVSLSWSAFYRERFLKALRLNPVQPPPAVPVAAEGSSVSP
jgi:hypothetical protein